jgi:rifampin ADP-ribosylating transferase
VQSPSSNKIVKYCTEGQRAEENGDIDNARALYQKAWEQANNDFEKFTAARCMARNQNDPNDELKWNLASIHFAHMLEGDEVKCFFSALHLNAGGAYEKLKDFDGARQHYGLAATYLSYANNDINGKKTRERIEAALKRVQGL